MVTVAFISRCSYSLRLSLCAENLLIISGNQLNQALPSSDVSLFSVVTPDAFYQQRRLCYSYLRYREFCIFVLEERHVLVCLFLLCHAFYATENLVFFVRIFVTPVSQCRLCYGFTAAENSACFLQNSFDVGLLFW